MWNDKFNDLKKIAYNKPGQETVLSIAEMESALANLLNAKVDVLNNNADRWTPKEILTYTENLEGTLKKVILKEIVMLLLLDEKDHHPKKCHCHDKKKCGCVGSCHCHDRNKYGCWDKCHCHRRRRHGCNCKKHCYKVNEYESHCYTSYGYTKVCSP